MLYVMLMKLFRHEFAWVPRIQNVAKIFKDMKTIVLILIMLRSTPSICECCSDGSNNFPHAMFRVSEKYVGT